MELTEMFTAIVRVAFLALAFGAGIPALFALGMRCLTGDPIRDENGVVVDDTPASAQMKALGMAVYAALAVVIVIAIMWVARDSIEHYFGLTPFGSL